MTRPGVTSVRYSDDLVGALDALTEWCRHDVFLAQALLASHFQVSDSGGVRCWHYGLTRERHPWPCGIQAAAACALFDPFIPTQRPAPADQRIRRPTR